MTRLAKILIGLLAAALLLLVLAAVALQTAWAKEYLRGLAERQAERFTGAEVQIGALTGNLFTGAVLHDVAITRAGRPVMTAPRVQVGYGLADLLTGEIEITRIALENPAIYLRRTEEGPLNLAVLGTSQPPPTRSAPASAAPRRGWAIADLSIHDGTLHIGDEVVTTDAANAPERLVDLDAALSVRAPAGETGVRLGVDALSFRTEAPALTVSSASGELSFSSAAIRLDDVSLQTSAGTVQLDGSITNRQANPIYDLNVQAQQLSFATLAPFVPALESMPIRPTIKASVQGPLSALDAQLAITSEAGTISGDLTVDAAGPTREVNGTITTEDVNLAGWRSGGFEPTDLSMTAQLDLQIPEDGLTGMRGTYSLRAPEFEYASYEAANLQASGRIEGQDIEVDATADIYGGRARVEGAVGLPAGDVPIRYDLDAELRDIDPTRLPQGIRPDAAGSIRRRGNQPKTPAPSARGGQGIDVDVSIRGQGSNFETEGRLLDVSLAGADFGENTTVDVSRRNGRTHVDAAGTVQGLNLQRLGRELGLAALNEPRWDSEINAAFDLSGSGTSLQNLTLRGTATLRDSELFGARVPALHVSPDFTRGSGTVVVEGQLSGLNLGAVLDRPALESDLQATIVDARVTLDDLSNPNFSLGALQARGRVTLGPSTLAGVQIAAGVVDGVVTDTTLTINQVTMTGPDLAIEMSGALALNDSGSATLRYLIDTPALQRLEALPIAVRGDVLVDGRATGNLGRLHLEGTISGTHVGYGGSTALSLHSTYELSIPDLDVSRAHVIADTELSGVEAAGQSFMSIAAHTTYEQPALAFTTTIEDAERTFTSEGRLLWHPDHQEVHLRRLDLEGPGVRWYLRGDREATVRYAGNAIKIGDFTLVNDSGGRVTLDGALGESDQKLEATVVGLQLSTVDDLFLDQPLSGVIDASATITGAMAKPTIDATLEVLNGSYRGFAFEQLAGEIAYQPTRLRLDLQLRQSAWATLTAEGVVPLGAESGAALDLTVRSERVDLALVSALTDEVQDVTGTAEVDVRATGSLQAPLVEGTIAVEDGAFTVTVAQSRYRDFNARILFERDLVTIPELQVLDDEGNKLTLDGQLGLRGVGIDDVNLRLRAENFELSDNRLVELNVDSDLQISGHLMRPTIAGLVAVSEGSIRIDRIFDVLQGPSSVAAEATEADEGGGFAPRIAVDVSLGDQLVVRGTDLRAAGGVPIGLGDVNITLGGHLIVRKAPEADLVLRGEIETVRGTYEFQGREFDIARGGRVILLGGDEFNPRLDITATRDISGVVASVHIGGVLREPQLELTSRPPMGDAEILSLIVFNQPLSLLGAGEQVSLATRAAALASGFLASRLTESLSDALELDVFEFETEAVSGAGVAPILTVGEQFGQLFLKLRQRFGAEAVSQVVLEYQFTDWLRLQSAYAQGDQTTRRLLQRIEVGGINLLFRFTY